MFRGTCCAVTPDCPNTTPCFRYVRTRGVHISPHSTLAIHPVTGHCHSVVGGLFGGTHPSATPCRVCGDPFGREVLEGGEAGGRGTGTQKFVHWEWPNQIFPTANFGFSDRRRVAHPVSNRCRLAGNCRRSAPRGGLRNWLLNRHPTP